ncbi:hypothetical protein LX32DRAFT_17198 [Colletotrichum zoysiae]|uniref:Uncharacterized protein n=1 Tax=Colletotrichum zoysiae TaxID=1216348 RepID=A0AAD9LZB9_9PEZI|nr:hypothetical protein LX32DRAFT_17198 [Colletotrichum zoysiae]
MKKKKEKRTKIKRENGGRLLASGSWEDQTNPPPPPRFPYKRRGRKRGGKGKTLLRHTSKHPIISHSPSPVGPATPRGGRMSHTKNFFKRFATHTHTHA